MKQKLMNFFGVITQSKTYRNMLCLFILFPLGIIYFVIVVTGIFLGFGLIITLFGIPVLFGIILLWRVLANFERKFIRNKMGININYVPMKKQKQWFLKSFKTYLKDSFTWKSLVYLLLRFPLGIISFVILVVFISVSLSFIASPFVFHLLNIGVLNGDFVVDAYTFINTYWFTVLVWIVGVLLVFVSLHIFNYLMHAFGLLSKFILNKKSK